jgi:hypothetical protein
MPPARQPHEAGSLIAQLAFGGGGDLLEDGVAERGHLTRTLDAPAAGHRTIDQDGADRMRP